MNQAYVVYAASLELSRQIRRDQAPVPGLGPYNDATLSSLTDMVGGDFETHKYNPVSDRCPGNSYVFDDGTRLIVSHGRSGNESATYWLGRRCECGKPRGWLLRQVFPELDMRDRRDP
jgi:hypothetical protein